RRAAATARPGGDGGDGERPRRDHQVRGERFVGGRARVSVRSLPERYVRLCLRVDAHIEDFVDAYVGPAELRDEIPAQERTDPAALREQAVALRGALPGAGLEDDRQAWLLGQLRGLECVTARLAGEEIAWSDEVERCFGIRPQHVDESAFRESHARLDSV